MEEEKTVQGKPDNQSNTTVGSASSHFSRRRMSDAEYNQRRELGLCFRCEEKFGPNHKCKNRQLRVILMEEEEEDGPDDLEEAQEELGPEKEMASLELSMTTAVGLTGDRTLKMGGMLG